MLKTHLNSMATTMIHPMNYTKYNKRAILIWTKYA